MTIEEMKNRKIELGLSNETIARMSGVPFSTVQKVFSGKTAAPRQATIEALEKVLKKTPAGEDFQTGALSEAAVPYGAKKQGEYTLEDYYAIPDDRRVELIDGEIFDMGAPTVRHQIIIGELHILFRECIESHGKDCRVLLSPCDVQLDNDEKTMVQPDLLVMCHEYDRNGICIKGAPDLTIEILSDSTRSKDLLLKTYKYKNAGVREYWIVDPKNKEVLVYDFSDEDLQPEKYGFTDEIPIHISDGECRIDFNRVNDDKTHGHDFKPTDGGGYEFLHQDSTGTESGRHIHKVGEVNSSQDGVIISSQGVAPCHSAGHGNCPKVIEE